MEQLHKELRLSRKFMDKLWKEKSGGLLQQIPPVVLDFIEHFVENVFARVVVWEE